MRRVLYSSARRFGVRGLPRRTRVHEVAPRDGLQNETTVLSTPAKLSLIRQLVASGPSSVEVTSFVRADVIPALADADEVCAQLWQQEWAHDARATAWSSSDSCSTSMASTASCAHSSMR